MPLVNLVYLLYKAEDVTLPDDDDQSAARAVKHRSCPSSLFEVFPNPKKPKPIMTKKKMPPVDDIDDQVPCDSSSTLLKTQRRE
jgi:hypothetical protein